MAATTVGVKVDEALRARLRRAAEQSGRTPHWLIKQGLLLLLDRIERGEPVGGAALADDTAEEAPPESAAPQPFLEFAQGVQPQSVLRAAITAAYRRPEPDCLPALIAGATLPPSAAERAQALAAQLVTALRGKRRGGGVEGLIQEFSLSSQEGVALMCLAEALLRIPDRPTRDALIRDKIAHGDWHAHLGHSPSLFVNAAAWGLMITGRLVATQSESGLSHALTRLIGRGGEPLIRKGVDLAMRLMGEQFVCGQTIAEALASARRFEARGFRYSYDMLGEAAMTAADAQRYLAAYEQAIHAIGAASARRGIYEGPGISVKLSALHPRYARAQAERVTEELLPRLLHLARLARRYDIGLNIDAEEADRLELSLDLLEAVCADPDLAGWSGIGFVVQAYQKRAPFVIDWLIDLARRSGHRLMVRLVKGAYWDSEIKRAQVDGLEGYPVFTRKVHTDVSYLACARRLLAAPDAVFPQFATHNARTLAGVMEIAGGNFYAGQYEFQCLHGMGEPLYEDVVGRDRLDRPCRIYAPVGTHETLLAYLVRRLLENGANTSFVNRIADPAVPVEELVADPAAVAAAIVPLGAPHPKIVLPRELFGAARVNSAGIDFSNEQRLASLSAALLASADTVFHAAPLHGRAAPQPVRNPADRRDLVGHVIEADDDAVDAALAVAAGEGTLWQATPPEQRAAALLRAADLLEANAAVLMGLIVREAGRTLPNALGEVREASDFLRYYAGELRGHFTAATHRPLGPVACISPWNFPLAIFVGQIAAALAAGNPVLAKPAEETPLVAAQALRLLHQAGIPPSALHLLPGDGRVGARLVGDARVRGVMLTGSTDTARRIAQTLAQRLDPEGRPIPLIAETGGQNALIVDSSALPEQVVADALASAFDSAGQRCSALRVLCVQDEAYARIRTMLLGAAEELCVGNPDRLATDVGPVITDDARDGILAHVEAMRARGRTVHQVKLPQACRHGSFVPPTIIEIDSMTELEREVFGPVLHLLRYRRDRLDALVDAINATGYALTFGVHSRIDETIAHLATRAAAGNVYVNRNMIGAVVGVQPFGGHGLSGTGPKAGGPLILRRLLSAAPLTPPRAVPADAAARTEAARAWVEFARPFTTAEAARGCERAIECSAVGMSMELPGPVGERNLYALAPRGRVLCMAGTPAVMVVQVAAALAAGNVAVVLPPPDPDDLLAHLPAALRGKVRRVNDARGAACDVVLYEGDAESLRGWLGVFAAAPGPVVPVHALPAGALLDGTAEYDPAWLVTERAVSTNTAAAGGNASLMSVG
ncbi:MAG: trifunctional transcriptional regulator/proline dehydrogenase/L-glutamate gamma-semialdehyde dehydrogenase [Rhodospirillales bacterium]|nr:trifunctional transcriptional regulator/proline dehydrogenase/L-glutamate gamma-semialdehyde dehydrogenase [Rhodospirillales bacterium]